MAKIINTKNYPDNNPLSYHIVTLGCDKNKVESEKIARSLFSAAFLPSEAVGQADLIVINTCAFIKEAIEETLNEIFSLIGLEQKPYIVVSGCLVDRYQAEFLKKQIPEIDFIMPSSLNEKSGELISSEIEGYKKSKQNRGELNLAGQYSSDSYLEFSEATKLKEGYAFIKISEGCNRNCSFCTIPSFKGKMRSIAPNLLIADITQKCKLGIKEINLVAQDLISYGTDFNPPVNLLSLLRQIVAVENLQWLRLLYLYPDFIDEKLLHFITEEEKMVKYLDIPMQHVSAKILSAMHRPGNGPKYINLIRKIRSIAPDIAIRSSFIVGYPGESEGDFQQLVDFIAEAQLNHVGLFLYSDEEGTDAFDQLNKIDKSIAENRMNKILTLQKEISRKHLQKRVGQTLDILIEEQIEENEYYGRTQWDAPEVDGHTYVYSRSPLRTGNIIKAEISQGLEYDLLAEID